MQSEFYVGALMAGAALLLMAGTAIYGIWRACRG
jgi:hypothetical protein